MMMRAYYSFFQGEFSDGWRRALWFSVVINVNLAMMNMLPLPVLDGGHIDAGAGHHYRQRRTAQHDGTAVGLAGRDYLGADQLHRRCGGDDGDLGVHFFSPV